MGFIEFFQDSRNQESAVNLLQNPIRSDIISNISAIKFKNRLGQYTIKKDDTNWILQEPRIIPAKEKTINSILKSLQNIKVHTIHQYEPINFQSFSLDNPVMEIDLYTKLDEKISILVGLINPIDNTSYITISGHKRIFQTRLLKGQLEALELSDFIDPKVFSMKLNKISKLQIFHGNNKTAYNDFTQTNDQWQTKKYKIINQERMAKKLSAILNIRTHKIIDQQTEELKTFINNYTSSPLYRVKIKTQDHKIITYKITHLIKAISDLKIEKKQYFIITASNRPYPYIINKSFLDDLIIRYSDIRN